MGYLLNVSFMVDASISGQWINFMNDKFLPFVKTQSILDRITFSKVLSATVEDSYIFSLLVEFSTLDGYKLFQTEIMEQYVQFAQPLFDSKTTHFMSLMKRM
ncbi:MAG: DUF4286 family protein [Rikenellaceae bacterium]